MRTLRANAYAFANRREQINLAGRRIGGAQRAQYLRPALTLVLAFDQSIKCCTIGAGRLRSPITQPLQCGDDEIEGGFLHVPRSSKFCVARSILCRKIGF